MGSDRGPRVGRWLIGLGLVGLAIFLAWGPLLPDSWSAFLGALPVRALLMVVILVGFAMLGILINRYFWYPADPKEMVFWTAKTLGSVLFMFAVVTPAISYVRLVAEKTGRLEGEIRFTDFSLGQTAVVITCIIGLLLCAALHVHVHEHSGGVG